GVGDCAHGWSGSAASAVPSSIQRIEAILKRSSGSTMQKIKLWLYPVALLTGVSPAALEATELRAAVTKADITPQTKEVMWGFEERLTPASGTLDPLFARVLVLEAGKTRLGIVTLD